MSQQGQKTLKDLRLVMTTRLRNAGIETAGLDARLLLQHALGLDAAGLISRELDLVDPARLLEIEALVQSRETRMPLARITGEKEFWGLSFCVNDATLIPRPDTETLIEAAITLLGPRRNEPITILDVGTGSGCLLVSLLHEFPNAIGIGTDVSMKALVTAKGNAERLGVGARAHFIQTQWASCLSGPFDVIVSNPPYIPEADIRDLEPEVALHDPALALSGGADGLTAYRALAQAMTDLIAAGGCGVVEIGHNQEGDVSEIFYRSRLTRIEIPGRDLAGVVRCLAVKSCSNDTPLKDG